MKRQGMGWNAKKGLFVVKGEKQEQEPQEVGEENSTGKVSRIIALFEKKVDGKEIAKTLRFSSYQEMADYMRSKGYLWDNEKQNYSKTVEKAEVKSSKRKSKSQKESTKGNEKINSDSISEQRIHQCECLKKYDGILELLETNKDKLFAMLKSVGEASLNLPRYSIRGYTVTKSIDISNALDQLLKDYSKDKNISQREIVQVALIEFLKQYGYADEVKTVLHI